MTQIFLGLGTNLGDRDVNLREAIRHLNANQVLVQRLSPIYETEPEGVLDQPRFLNAVADAQTELAPALLLATVKNIETAMKRQPTVKNGPRIIDIDILFYGSAILKTAELEIPHPRLRERRFVLQPLADLAPGWRDPLTGCTAMELLLLLPG